MEIKENKRPQDCIICDGKYDVSVVATTCTSEPVCKKHMEEIIEILRKKQKNI